jgi:23S rRNA (cytidine1920-2'-O)/16S rRNA (cytidine1409-2'-O)-methyltransferase
VSKSRRARFVALTALVARHHPDLDPRAITDGRVLVDGRVLANPAARVRVDASIRVRPVRRLRGAIKLSHALDVFMVTVDGRVAVDIGASAGGFTTALVERGALRVYAVDVGVGQLLDRLRTDDRVINLEGRNLANISASTVPEPVGLITMDLSYLPASVAVPQLAPLIIADAADLIVLVKPTFELRRATLARSDDDITEAIRRATDAMIRCGWIVSGTCAAPTTGRGGAREAFIHAIRAHETVA